MKLILVVVAILGLTNALPRSSLREELQDFLDLLPRDKMVAHVKQCHESGDFDNIINYVKSPEFADALAKVRDSEELNALVAFLREKGVDVEVIKEWMRKIAGMIPLDAELSETIVQTKAFSDCWAGFKELIPTEEIKALWIEKRESSAVIQELIATLKSDRVKEYVHHVWNLEAVQNVMQKMREHGVDLERIVAWMQEHLGW